MSLETKKAEAVAQAGPTILVVDDDPSILRIVQLTLERSGYVVKTAANGQEAIKMLRKMVPAVLILDVTMPGMSGYEVCRSVKRDKRLENVPVVFLTAQGSPQDYKTGHDAGAVVYMVKPFNPEGLAQVVRMLSPPPEA